jgi:hypothetical protein
MDVEIMHFKKQMVEWNKTKTPDVGIEPTTTRLKAERSSD